MSTNRSNHSTTTFSTTSTTTSDRSCSPSTGRSDSPALDDAIHENRPDVHARRMAFQARCEALRAAELASDTASQNSILSDDEETLCEGSSASIEQFKPDEELESAATKTKSQKPNRGCISRNFGNVYISTSTSGRKTIGTASGAPGGCATM